MLEVGQAAGLVPSPSMRRVDVDYVTTKEVGNDSGRGELAASQGDERFRAPDPPNSGFHTIAPKKSKTRWNPRA